MKRHFLSVCILLSFLCPFFAAALSCSPSSCRLVNVQSRTQLNSALPFLLLLPRKKADSPLSSHSLFPSFRPPLFRPKQQPFVLLPPPFEGSFQSPPPPLLVVLTVPPLYACVCSKGGGGGIAFAFAAAPFRDRFPPVLYYTPHSSVGRL